MYDTINSSLVFEIFDHILFCLMSGNMKQVVAKNNNC